MWHILLHILLPLLVARTAFHNTWVKAWLLLLLTMLVDLDHLLANPIYDPNRCSIGHHPLHQPELFPLYLLCLLFPQTRLLGLGLVIHMSLDSLDCVAMGQWFTGQ
ncbi:DUF6122 family protein [Marinicella sediminis]|uniref:DUF6122 family protein n=1 Tax=Marinicella sediminis TaxID=1792834 RepID=A0ABV7JC32_9GAMM|nr:DUF6122 family protein [Marinicella sediminis]